MTGGETGTNPRQSREKPDHAFAVEKRVSPPSPLGVCATSDSKGVRKMGRATIHSKGVANTRVRGQSRRGRDLRPATGLRWPVGKEEGVPPRYLASAQNKGHMGGVRVSVELIEL